MAIYQKPARLLFRDMVQELGIGPGETLTRDRILEWFTAHYPKITGETIRCQLVRLSTNATSRMHYGASVNGDDDLFYQINPRTFRLYDPQSDPRPIYEKPGHAPADPDQPLAAAGDDDEALDEAEFAYEQDLQNFLAKNLGLIKPGLRLYEDDGANGIEYPCGGRFIDILAVDPKNNYVVIELKVSRAYDRVVGQLLRYMGWVKRNLAGEQQTVSGVIVAREISDDLKLATSMTQNIQLFEYKMSVTLSSAVD